MRSVAKTVAIQSQLHSTGAGVQRVSKMRVGLTGRVEEDCQGTSDKFWLKRMTSFL